MRKFFFLLYLLINISLILKAQFTIYNIQLSQPSNASQLVDKLVGTGVTYSNASFTGSYGGTEAGNAGYFSGGTNVIGLNSGIVLSTGNVGRHWYTNTLIAGPNYYFNLGTATGTGADATLQAIVGAQTYDKAVLEFEFIPESNFIQFRYVFASEEYNEWVNKQYNDVFGFFVTSLESDGYNYNNKNIAIVPGTTNTPVSINTVNNGPCSGAPNCNTAGIGPCTNCAYYFDNATGTRQIEYDGFTRVLTASCYVTPCKRYRMKIAIADVSDQWLDSGVFLEENSFVSPIINDISYNTSNSNAGGGTNMVEGCSNGSFTFTLSSPTPINRNVPITIGGTAQFGVDYYTIPDISGTYTPPNNYYVTIPAGQTSTTLTIVPIQDGLVESTESVEFTITTNLCPPYNTSSGTVYILDNSTPFSASLPSSVDICAGSSTQLNVNINGGQSPLSYQWSSGHTTNPINVNPGSTTTYSVTITDACNLTTTASTTVNVNPIPSAIPSVYVQSICSGSSTNINLNSNVQGATFTWTATGDPNVSGYSSGTGNGIYQTLYNSSSTPQNVTYTITASANGCTGSPANVGVTVNPSPIISNVSVTPVTVCVGQPDGTITITASGGTSPLSYSLNGGPFQASNVFTNVGAGNHNVIVQDAAGCQVSQSNIQVTTTSGPVINQIFTTNVDCYGQNNGSITIIATGATEYSIDNGQTWYASNTFTGLSAGTYPVLVRDAGMCIAPAVAQVTSPTEITATFTTVDELCGNIGSTTINVSGGTPLYTYLWNTGSTSNSINAYSGNYSVTVTDANNCTKVFNVTIGNIPAPNIISVSTTNVSCYNGNNGSIFIQAQGAQFYSIDNGNTWSSSSVFSNLPAGTYNVIIRDANSCTDSEMVTITSPTEIIATVNTTPEVCGSPGSASIVVSGGVSPYNYLWNTGSTNSYISGVSAGTYTVTVTDANGCTKIFTTIVDFQGGNAQINYQVTNVLCYGQSNGAIHVTVSNITPPYTVNWSHTSDTSLIQQNLAAGAYNITVADGFGCSSVATISVSQPAPLNLSYQISNISCHNANDGIIALTVNGGIPPYNYIWSNGQTSATISPLSQGIYSVTVTDANNCSIVETGLQIINPSQLQVNIITTNPKCYNTNDGMLVAQAIGGTPPYYYQWTGNVLNDTIANLSPGIYTVTVVDANFCNTTAIATLTNTLPIIITGNVTVTNHIASIDISVYNGMLPYSYLWSTGSTSEDLYNLGGGNYIVTVTDALGCTAVDTFFVDIPLQIPNVITPNGDGKNDDFEIIGIQAFSEISIEIFGRWGDKLFEYKGSGLDYVSANNRWKGKYNGKDLPTGSYVYIIILDDNEPIKGVVSIVR